MQSDALDIPQRGRPGALVSKRRSRLIGRLQRRKSREREGLFLAEGVRCAGTVLDSSVRIRFALCSPPLRSTPAGNRLRQRLADTGAPVQELSEGGLAALATTDSPQGVLLICEQPRPDLARTLTPASRVLVADRIQDPGNLGTLIRSAAAFALDAVVALDGTVDPFNAKAVRASAGAVVQIPVFTAAWHVIAPLLAELPLLVATASGRAVTAALPRWALVLGNEADGARNEILAASAGRVSIPIAAQVDSLNAAAAGAILMYALSRQG